MSEHLNEALSTYLDGELDEAARAAAESHLAACAECRVSLEGLRGLVRRAHALDDRPPERDLWARIAERIGEPGAADVVPLEPRRRRFIFSVPQLAAAAVALMAVSGGTGVLLTRGGAGRPGAATSASPVRVTTVALPGQRALDSYDAAIGALQQTLTARRGQLDTSTVRVIEQSLQVIDLAIAQARAALTQDPNNQYLNSHLQRALDRKLDVLRRAATLPVVS
jgi:anti-sigma factor RsiW